MNVFATRILPAEGSRLLRENGVDLIEYSEKTELRPEELIRQCAKADALISSGPNKLNRNFFSHCRHLKAVSLLSVGFDNVDLTAATDYGIPVGNTPGVLNNATADTAFLLMLSVARNAFYMHRSILEGKWGFYEPTANLGIELNGKILGIYGMGRIGMNFARKCAAAFDMDIYYHNRRRNVEAEMEIGAKWVPFDVLLSLSDIISVHASLNPESAHAFNVATFKKMKSSAIFINTARGAIHDERDLINALTNGEIYGAGLDVMLNEPCSPDNPLLTLPNVCVLPHIGSATVEARNAMSILAAQNILAALKNDRMPHVVNPEVYIRRVASGDFSGK